MHELQSLEKCAGMWKWISDELTKASENEAIDIEDLKREYCDLFKVDWTYHCALCQLTGVNCKVCPLLDTWQERTITDDHYPCCADSSPYMEAMVCADSGLFEEAIAEIQVIVDACDRQIKWWANLKEMNQ